MSPKGNNQSGIKDVLRGFSRGWREENASTLLALWDESYPDCSYIASEIEQPLHGIEEIAQYYDEALDLFEITHMSISDVTVDQTSEDRAHAFCNIEIGFSNGEWEKTVYPRATFLLRRRQDDWKIIHYHESIQYDVPD